MIHILIQSEINHSNLLCRKKIAKSDLQALKRKKKLKLFKKKVLKNQNGCQDLQILLQFDNQLDWEYVPWKKKSRASQ